MTDKTEVMYVVVVPDRLRTALSAMLTENPETHNSAAIAALMLAAPRLDVPIKASPLLVAQRLAAAYDGG